MNMRTSTITSTVLVAVLLSLATFTSFTGFWNVLAFLYGLSTGIKAITYFGTKRPPREGTEERKLYEKKAQDFAHATWLVDAGIYVDLVFAMWASYSEHYFIAVAIMANATFEKGLAVRYERFLKSQDHAIPFEEKP